MNLLQHDLEMFKEMIPTPEAAAKMLEAMAKIAAIVRRFGGDSEPEPDEVIEGLSPGEWTYSRYESGGFWGVVNASRQSGAVLARVYNESDAKFIAGSKALLEAIYAFAVESELNTKTWGRPSWNAVAYAMVNCGIEFPTDE